MEGTTSGSCDDLSHLVGGGGGASGGAPAEPIPSAGAGGDVGEGEGKGEGVGPAGPTPTAALREADDHDPCVSGADFEGEDEGEEEEEDEDREAAIDTNVKLIKELVPEESVTVYTKNFMHLVLAKTPFRRLTVKLAFPRSFKTRSVWVELSSATLSSRLLKKLESTLSAEAAKRRPEEQAFYVVDALHTMVQNNKLMFAFEEVRDIKEAVDGLGRVKVSETAGTVRVAISKGSYACTFVATVPDEYPSVGPSLSIVSTNFHEDLVRPHMAQANEIVRRCCLGYDISVALSTSNPVKAPPSITRGDPLDTIRVTTTLTRDLKHDVAFLKQAKELRQVDQTRKKGDANRFAKSAAERKTARRQLKKLTAEEAAAEEKRLAELEAAAKRESSVMTAKPSELPVPSLAAVVIFLAKRFVERLATDTCKLCDKTLLPTDASKAARIVEREDHPKHPERVYCGHWFHFKCLDEHLTSPPFEKFCPSCEKRIYHPKWSSDLKKLEKQWAMEQAHKRELAEISDLLDLGEEFTIRR